MRRTDAYNGTHYKCSVDELCTLILTIVTVLYLIIKHDRNMKRCRCCGPKVRYTILLLVGAILIALPLALHHFIDEKVREQIADNVKIKPGSQIYDEWKKPTLPVYLQIYVFSIVNHLEVIKGEPPFVWEKGPYSYRESREKINITWGDNNVNYNQVTRYTFDPTTSCDGCDPKKDVVTSLNIPFVTLVQRLAKFSHWKIFHELVSVMLEYIKEDLFNVNKTVDETVWGYKDPLFEDYDEFYNLAVGLDHNLKKVLPKIPPVFALQPNPSYDGNTTVRTGEHDISEVGCYEQWKDNFGKLNIWKSNTANMLNGTDGAVYKPDISKDDALYIFVTQLCRSLNVNYLDEVTIQGIDGYRFHPPKYLFESGDINPNNKGFCNPNCLPSGLLSVNACVPFNAPIVASQPHFLNGDETLRQTVLGLKPNKDKHDTFVSLEPHTGVLLQAQKRLQFNLQVKPISGFKSLENVVPAVVPIIWINEEVSLDSANAKKLKKNVLNNLEMIKWFEIGLMILGGIMVLIAMILFIRLCRRKNDGSRLTLLVENRDDYGSVSHSNGHSGRLNPSLINASD